MTSQTDLHRKNQEELAQASSDGSGACSRAAEIQFSSSFKELIHCNEQYKEVLEAQEDLINRLKRLIAIHTQKQQRPESLLQKVGLYSIDIVPKKDPSEEQGDALDCVSSAQIT